MHLSEEDLILHYYGELPEGAGATEHLGGCARCQSAMAELTEVLSLVDRQTLPEPLAGLERRVWSRIEPEFRARPRSWFSRLFDATPRWALAGGAAGIILSAFVAGRVSGPAVVTPASPEAPRAVAGFSSERVLAAAIGDHLDQSEIVLVELLNADLDASGLAGGRTLARDLVSANRLYRQTATRSGDEALGDVLDDLERLLLEIANASPAGQSDVALVGAQVQARDLLFRLRVIAAEMRAQEQRVVGAQPQS